jgi:hypothetical protein
MKIKRGAQERRPKPSRLVVIILVLFVPRYVGTVQ